MPTKVKLSLLITCFVFSCDLLASNNQSYIKQCTERYDDTNESLLSFMDKYVDLNIINNPASLINSHNLKLNKNNGGIKYYSEKQAVSFASGSYSTTNGLYKLTTGEQYLSMDIGIVLDDVYYKHHVEKTKNKMLGVGKDSGRNGFFKYKNNYYYYNSEVFGYIGDNISRYPSNRNTFLRVGITNETEKVKKCIAVVTNKNRIENKGKTLKIY